MKKLLKKIIVPLLIVSIIFFAFTSRTYAAITLVQTAKGGYGYVNTLTQTLTSTGAGNTLILEITSGDADTVSSLTDNKGSTYTLIASDKNTGQRQTWLYYLYNIPSGITSITLTWGASQFADANIIVREYSGLTTTDPLDVSAHANDGGAGSTSHPTGTTGTTAQASELAVVASGCANTNSPTYSAPSGYGNLTEQKGSDLYTHGAMADKTLSSTGTQTASFGTTASCVGEGIIATFKTPAVATPVVARMVLNNGVMTLNRGTLIIN